MANINVSVSQPNVTVTNSPANISVTDLETSTVVNVTQTAETINVSSTTANITVTEAGVTNEVIRKAIGVENVSGYGNLSYSNANGIISYVGVSGTDIAQEITNNPANVRTALSASDLGGDGSFSYNSSSGVFTYTGPDQTEANARIAAAPLQVRQHLSGGFGITYSNTTGVIETSNSDIRSLISNTSPIAYDSATGVISLEENLANITLQQFQETVVDNGNISGNVTFDLSAGTIHTGTIVGDITGITLSSVQEGSSITILLTQDSIGGHALDTTTYTANWSSYDFIDDYTTLSGTPTTGRDVITITYDGTNYNTSVGNFESVNPASLTVTGNITSTSGVFNGNGAGLTGIVGSGISGTVANANYSVYAETVLGASQTNITTVGTLTALDVTGNIDGNGNLDIQRDATIQGDLTVNGDRVDFFVANANISGDLYAGNIDVGGPYITLNTPGAGTGNVYVLVDGLDGVDYPLIEWNNSAQQSWTIGKGRPNLDPKNQGGFSWYEGNDTLQANIIEGATLNLSGNVNSGPLYVTGDSTIVGNLEVQGNIDYVNVEDLLVNDQSITLNYGNASARDAFIYVDRTGTGGGTNSHIKWNETANQWEFFDGTSTTLFSDFLQNVVEDTSPQLGANLDVNGYNVLFESGEKIVFEGGYGAGTGADISGSTTTLDIKSGANALLQSYANLTLDFAVDNSANSFLEITDSNGFREYLTAVWNAGLTLGGRSNTNINVPVGGLGTEPITVNGPIDFANSQVTGTFASNSNITTTANVQGAYILGDGSQLSNLPSGISNADAKAYIEANGLDATANLTTTANVQGSWFIGNVNATTIDVVNMNVTGNVTSNANIDGNLYVGGTVFATAFDGDGSDLTSVRAETIEITIKNADTVQIDKGMPVHAVGTAVGGEVEVVLADASNASLMPAHFIANETLASTGDTGRGILSGRIFNIDTSSFSVGDVIYVGAGGGYANVAPAGEANLIQNLGVVTEANATSGQGEVYGAGRSAATPNLNDGNIFIGDASNASVTATLDTSIVPENTNLYYTDARANSAMDAYLTSITANVDSVNGLTGVVSIGLLDLDDVGADGANGQVLTTDGLGNFTFQTANTLPGSGSVTQVDTDGVNILGGPITTTGTVSLSNSLANVNKVASETSTALTAHGQAGVQLTQTVDSSESRIVDINTDGYSTAIATLPADFTMGTNIPGAFVVISLTAGSSTGYAVDIFGGAFGAGGDVAALRGPGYSSAFSVGVPGDLIVTTDLSTPFPGAANIEAAFTTTANNFAGTGANGLANVSAGLYGQDKGWLPYDVATAGYGTAFPANAYVTGMSGAVVTFSEPALVSGARQLVFNPGMAQTSNKDTQLLYSANVWTGANAEPAHTTVLTGRQQPYNQPQTQSNVTYDAIAYGNTSTVTMSSVTTKNISDFEGEDESATRFKRALLIGPNTNPDPFSGRAENSNPSTLGVILENDGVSYTGPTAPRPQFLINNYTGNLDDATDYPVWATSGRTGNISLDMPQIKAGIFNFKAFRGGKIPQDTANYYLQAGDVVGKIAWSPAQTSGTGYQGIDLVNPPASITVDVGSANIGNVANTYMHITTTPAPGTNIGYMRNNSTDAGGANQQTNFTTKDGNVTIAAQTSGMISLAPTPDYGDSANSTVWTRYPGTTHEYHRFMDVGFADKTNKTGTFVEIQPISGNTASGGGGGLFYNSAGNSTIRLNTSWSDNTDKWYFELNHDYSTEKLEVNHTNGTALTVSETTVDFTNIPTLPQYSNTALPTSVTGGMIYVTNGNNKPAYGDGTNWYYYDGTQVT